MGLPENWVGPFCCLHCGLPHAKLSQPSYQSMDDNGRNLVLAIERDKLHITSLFDQQVVQSRRL